MSFLTKILEILDFDIETPKAYGAFHLFFIALSIAMAVLLCLLHKRAKPGRETKIVFYVSLAVLLLEIYKQINYTFKVENGVITPDFQWYAFPWQFCSIPMYTGILAGIIKKGKVHNALISFLGTYSLFAGICVMVSPGDVFIDTLGINIQTMICHGSMITLGVYLLYSGAVKLKHRTMLYAMPVFASAMIIAMLLNDLAFKIGIPENETFNMFFISPHEEPHLPVYTTVQELIPFPLCTIIYFLAFSLAAYLILLVSMGISKIASIIKAKRARKT